MNVTELTLSCVREFLSKKGLKETLATLDKESPRSENAISKRSELAKCLRLEKIIRKNKESDEPLSTMLEMMAKYFMDKKKASESTSLSEISTENNTESKIESRDAIIADPKSTPTRKPRLRGVKQPPTDDEPKSQLHPRLRLVQPSSGTQGMELMEMEEVDEDLHLSKPGGTQRMSVNSASKGDVVSSSLVSEMNTLIFGSRTASWNSAWQVQNFEYTSSEGLEYGLVQKEGGPCGVVAVVQAYVIKHFMEQGELRKPTVKGQELALVNALSDIIWNAGHRTRAIAVLPRSNSLDALSSHEFTDLDSLRRFFSNRIKAYMSATSSSCIWLVYSAILSRSIKEIKSDMDDPKSKLMGAHSYCSQELVSLLLTGEANSNVFNGIKELGEGKDVLVLKGVNQQAEIGMLSLFDHYKSMEVGSNMKIPKLPIWVILSQSHYSVLYAENVTASPFDVFYYDPLGRQTDVYRITVDAHADMEPPDEDKELVSPIEHCIRTRWARARIDWNGLDGVF
eukprot:m.342730 g.342730  ORF g.342730 m.342730 type:complete len:511 (+) comp21758_c0_seq1:152-1684(+)